MNAARASSDFRRPRKCAASASICLITLVEVAAHQRARDRKGLRRQRGDLLRGFERGGINVGAVHDRVDDAGILGLGGGRGQPMISNEKARAVAHAHRRQQRRAGFRNEPEFQERRRQRRACARATWSQ